MILFAKSDQNSHNTMKNETNDYDCIMMLELGSLDGKFNISVHSHQHDYYRYRYERLNG